jgi:predicted transcriptional regulator
VSNQNSTWDRRELYEKVWQFPLRKLAAEYGISDVGLAKVCRKLEIPLPGLGHWTKIACGHSIPRPPLPALENVPVLVRQIRKPEIAVLPEDTPELERIRQVALSATPIVTKAMLTHPLIEKTRQVLNNKPSKDKEKLYASHELEWLDLRVTKNCLPRALRIMAALIHMLDQEGFKVVVEKKATESTSAVVYGEKIRFGLIERFKQIKPMPKPTTAAYSYNPVTLESTGILSIEVWNYYSGGPQKVWRDRESAKLEQQLPGCVAGMMRIALRERAEAKAQYEEQLAKQKKIEEVESELRKIQIEEKRIKALRRDAVDWHRAERLRRYIAAARDSSSKDTEWIAWAESQADRLDPLKENTKSIVDDKDEVLKLLHSVRWGW